MLPGTPFNAFSLPYRIRVDEFTQLPSQTQQPALHLLTHTHTEHVNGLASKSFGSVLLRHEVYMERELYQMQLKVQKTRTYSHLKADPVTFPNGSQNYTGSRDLLRPLPLNTPTVIELQNGKEVTLTLIDANHCNTSFVNRTLDAIYLNTPCAFSTLLIPLKVNRNKS
ncbi:hypothetical protein F5887DRAFT_1006791 [Amanita rubescens]|nr:hypothetical protein F5887DRAFT_1006791 [Amanita rubescens]